MCCECMGFVRGLVWRGFALGDLTLSKGLGLCGVPRDNVTMVGNLFASLNNFSALHARFSTHVGRPPPGATPPPNTTINLRRRYLTSSSKHLLYRKYTDKIQRTTPSNLISNRSLEFPPGLPIFL